MAACKECLHLPVCKSADSCDGIVPGCKHFMVRKERYLLKENGEIVPLANCQQWIPVTERLPKKQREYLCLCNIDGHNEYPFYMVLKYYLVDEKPHFQHECEHGLRVTHWMPLPEPPKGE